MAFIQVEEYQFGGNYYKLVNVNGIISVDPAPGMSDQYVRLKLINGDSVIAKGFYHEMLQLIQTVTGREIICITEDDK